MDLPVMPPLPPMLARAVTGVPAPSSVAGGLSYEPKWDGFRAIVFRDGDEVLLASRNLRPMTRYFPEVVAAVLAELPERCVIDGEIVIARGGRLDFEALQARIHPADSRVRLLAAETPAVLVAFDVLALDGRDLRDAPQADRRAALDGLTLRGPGVFATPSTRDHAVAQEWFETFEGAGLDGVVAKPLLAPYTPGGRAMLKVKHERTADCVLAGYRLHKDSTPERPLVGSLLLGLYDAAGSLQFVGVAASFPMAKRAALVQELAELRADADGPGHPWGAWQDPTAAPSRVSGTPAPGSGTPSPGSGTPAPGSGTAHPAVGTADAAVGTEGPGVGTAAARGDERRPGAVSRWNTGKDLSFLPLRPERVLEVAYDHMEGTRFRHTTQFRRWRDDRDPASCTYAQLDEPVRYDLGNLLAGA